MRVPGHAVNKYIERVLHIPKDQAGDRVRDFARKRIRKAANEPEIVYDHKEGYPPIHILDELAVPVEKDDGSGEIKVVTTTYHCNTYRSKLDKDGVPG